MEPTSPQSLVAHFYDEEVTPERLQLLIQSWDSAASKAQGGPDPDAVGPRGSKDLGQTFATELAQAIEVVEADLVHDLFDVEAVLRQVSGAALVVSAELKVLASNEAARAVFGVQPGEPLVCLPIEASGASLLAERLGVLELAPAGHEEVVQLRRTGAGTSGARVIHAHLRALPTGRGRPRFLIATTEQAWPDRLSAVMAGFFRLTPAEVEVTRWLSMGGTVSSIAAAARRSAGTVRSQLHAIFEKTGTASQADLLRLVGLLRQSTGLDLAPVPSRARSEPSHQFVLLRDGRRLEVLSFGDPEGAPVLRTQTYYGNFRLPASAENDLGRRGIRLIVPMRAGWAGSDSAPKGREILDVAVSDIRELLAQLGIAQATVMTSGDDIRIAMMLAQADPGAVRHIVGIGSGFPILNDAQYRRLFPVARFTRAAARYAPGTLPFMARAFRATMLRYGIEPYMRGMYASSSPPDACAFADREVADAVVAGIDYVFGHIARMEAAFCTEIRCFHEDWPPGLGDVACPVTLIHGAHDCNAPLATALDYCALYSRWRMIEFPDDGVLVAYARWREVLDLVGQAAGATPARPPDTARHIVAAGA